MVRQAEARLQIAADPLAQRGDAGIRGVFRLPVQEGIDARLPDMHGRDEIRLPDPQGDAVRHVVEQIEEAADAGRLDRRDPLGKNVFVVHMENRPSVFHADSNSILYACRI